MIRYVNPGRPRPIPSHADADYIFVLVVTLAVLALVVIGCVSCACTANAVEMSTPASITATQPLDTVESLRAELTAEKAARASNIAYIKRLKKAIHDSDSSKWHWRYLSLKRKWSKADLRWAVSHAGGDKWLRNAAVDIVFIGAAESHGDNKCVYGQHVGMFQWNAGWSGSRKQKMTGTWSVKRFVKVYRDGGQAAIRRHWAATLGR